MFEPMISLYLGCVVAIIYFAYASFTEITFVSCLHGICQLTLSILFTFLLPNVASMITIFIGRSQTCVVVNTMNIARRENLLLIKFANLAI